MSVPFFAVMAFVSAVSGGWLVTVLAGGAQKTRARSARAVQDLVDLGRSGLASRREARVVSVEPSGDCVAGGRQGRGRGQT